MTKISQSEFVEGCVYQIVKVLEDDTNDRPISSKNFGHLTKHCAFCKCSIEPNFYNACDECYYESVQDPDAFAAKTLGVRDWGEETEAEELQRHGD